MMEETDRHGARTAFDSFTASSIDSRQRRKGTGLVNGF